MRISGECHIADGEVTVRFISSRGPGGQNVNKLATRAVLLFDVAGSASLTDAQRARALTRLGARLSEAGVLQLRCDVHRTQSANRRAVIERFIGVMADALRVSRARRTTRPTGASRAERLKLKQRRSQVKRDRRRPPPEAE